METARLPSAPPDDQADCRKAGVAGRGILHLATIRRARILSLAILVSVVLVDIAVPLGVAAAVPYTFAILVGFNVSRRFAVLLAVVCCVLTVSKMFVLPDRGTTELWKVIANRSLAVFAIGMTTFLGLQRLNAEAAKEHAEEQAKLHLAELAHRGRVNAAGELGSTLAHELNQPLLAIALQSEVAGKLVAAQGVMDRPALLEALREITDQAHRAARIIRMLRNLVRKREPEWRTLRVNDLVDNVVRLIAAQARQARVELVVRPDPALPEVRGDRVQLEQVLMNLLQNAIEAFASCEGPARVAEVETTVAPDGHVQVLVRDAGIGLTPEDLARAFDHFYSTKPNGLGFGLAISRSIVEAHGGRLWGGPNEDRGATFGFTVPALVSTNHD